MNADAMASARAGYDTSLSRLKAVELKHTKVGFHHDGGGLYLQVREGRNNALTRSWVFRYTRQGKARIMGLGPFDVVGLADARKRAWEARRLLLDDIDPLEAREAHRAAQRVSQATAMTFRQSAEAYIAAQEAGWRNPKHAAQWSATLGTYVYPVFGNLPVASIDTGLVTKVLEPIWSAKPETASRVRGRIERVLDWATVRGYRQGENPARWRGHLENLPAPPATSQARGSDEAQAQVGEHSGLHHRRQIAEFMAALPREQARHRMLRALLGVLMT